MCNYQDWKIKKETSGIGISVPWWDPATLVCWDCSLSNEKYQYPLPNDVWPNTVKDNLGREYVPLKGCFCVAGKDFPGMARHVIEHIISGENIHPLVLIILEEAYDNSRIRLDYDWASRCQVHLMKLLGIGWEELNAMSLKPSYYTEYEEFPRLK